MIFKPNNQVKVKGTEERSRYDGMHYLNAIDANCEVKYEVKFFVSEQENINVFTLMRSTKSRLTTCVDKNSNWYENVQFDSKLDAGYSSYIISYPMYQSSQNLNFFELKV